LALGGGFAVALLFGNNYGYFECFFIGVIIASMSTSITVEALQEMGKLKTRTGTAILGASLFDDIFVIIILALTMGIGKGMTGVEGSFSIASIGIILIKIIIFFAIAVIIGLLVNKLFDFLYAKF
jgi:Kef-type K+ transport system membrane component KefB